MLHGKWCQWCQNWFQPPKYCSAAILSSCRGHRPPTVGISTDHVIYMWHQHAELMSSEPIMVLDLGLRIFMDLFGLRPKTKWACGYMSYNSPPLIHVQQPGTNQGLSSISQKFLRKLSRQLLMMDKTFFNNSSK